MDPADQLTAMVAPRPLWPRAAEGFPSAPTLPFISPERIVVIPRGLLPLTMTVSLRSCSRGVPAMADGARGLGAIWPLMFRDLTWTLPA